MRRIPQPSEKLKQPNYLPHFTELGIQPRIVTKEQCAGISSLATDAGSALQPVQSFLLLLLLLAMLEGEAHRQLGGRCHGQEPEVLEVLWEVDGEFIERSKSLIVSS